MTGDRGNILTGVSGVNLTAKVVAVTFDGPTPPAWSALPEDIAGLPKGARLMGVRVDPEEGATMLYFDLDGTTHDKPEHLILRLEMESTQYFGADGNEH
jgi:hypothetical protein